MNKNLITFPILSLIFVLSVLFFAPNNADASYTGWQNGNYIYCYNGDPVNGCGNGSSFANNFNNYPPTYPTQTNTNTNQTYTNTPSATNNTVSNTTKNTSVAKNTNTKTTTNTKNTTTDENSLAANAIFGAGSFIPNSFLQWLIVFILILLIVFLWRKIYVTDQERSRPLKHA